MLALVGNMGDLAVAITAIVTFLYGCYRYGVRPVSAALKRLERVEERIGTNGGQTIFDKLEVQDEQLAWLKATAEVSMTPFFFTDQHGRITYVNRQCERIIGHRQIDLLSWDWQEAIDRNDRPDVVREWREAVQQQRSFEVNGVFIRQDGAKVRLSVTAEIILSGPRLIGWRGVVERLHEA